MSEKQNLLRIANLETDNANLKQQRDDLLAACEYLIGDKSFDTIAHRLNLSGRKVQKIISIMAMAAIAKAKA